MGFTKKLRTVVKGGNIGKVENHCFTGTFLNLLNPYFSPRLICYSGLKALYILVPPFYAPTMCIIHIYSFMLLIKLKTFQYTAESVKICWLKNIKPLLNSSRSGQPQNYGHFGRDNSWRSYLVLHRMSNSILTLDPQDDNHT